MSGPISISSTAEWQSLLSSTNVVIADFYADWCGPCKMIAPHFDRLAKEHARPKKLAFAKVNVDSQQSIAQTEGVAAMPTFKIFHGGSCVETLKGASPPALAEAVSKAVRLSGSGSSGPAGSAFKTAGRKLGGGGRSSGGGGGTMSWDLNNLISAVITAAGLYLTSLLSFDPYKAAENSRFNIHQPPTPAAGSAPVRGSGDKVVPKGAAAQKPAFRTLADLGSE